MREAIKTLFLDAQEFLEEEKFDIALKLYQKALKAAKKDSDEEYYALLFLGMCYDDSGESEKSIEPFKSAQLLALKLWGQNCAEYAMALNNEAMAYMSMGHHHKSNTLFDTSLEIINKEVLKAKKLDGSTVRGAIEMYLNSGEAKIRINDISGGIQRFREGYELATKHLPVRDPKRFQIIAELSYLEAAVGNRAGALKLEQEALKLFANMKDVDSVEEMYFELRANMIRLFNGINLHSFKPETNASNVVPLFKDAKPPKKKSKQSKGKHGYVLKVTLRGIKPPVWRRIAVPANIKLNDLHELLQQAMGWGNCHLHQFLIDGVSYSAPTHLDHSEDETKFSLADFDLTESSKFEYDYDFGDDWGHTITVERLIDNVHEMKTFITARGACPPEDCGGRFGYIQLLDDLNDPKKKKKLPPEYRMHDPKLVPDCFE